MWCRLSGPQGGPPGPQGGYGNWNWGGPGPQGGPSNDAYGRGSGVSGGPPGAGSAAAGPGGAVGGGPKAGDAPQYSSSTNGGYGGGYNGSYGGVSINFKREANRARPGSQTGVDRHRLAASGAFAGPTLMTHHFL